MEATQREVRPDEIAFFRLWFEETVGWPPFPYQESLIRLIVKEKRPLIINKARQTGISTLIAAIGMSQAVFERKKVLVCSNREENAAHILEYAVDFLTSLRKMVKVPTVDTDKVTRLTFSNGGEIRCLSANPSTARGYPAHWVVFDEFAHFRGEANLDKKMLAAVAPSISQLGGTLIVLSTPYGKGNEFSRMWDSAPKANRFTVHYTECPTLKVHVEELPYGKRYWIEGSPTPLPEETFKTEYCNDFEAILSTAIPPSAIWAPENVIGDEEAWAE